MEDEDVVSRAAQRLLDDARAELTRAEDKASSALGAVSALVAVVAVAPSGLRPGREVVAWGWIFGLSICVLAMVLLMLAALPRFTTGSQRQVLTYFGDVSRVRHERDLGYLLRELAERPSEAVLSELRAISKIVVIKYLFTRLGILCAVTGGALLIMSAI
ncbi:MAG: Pycsar system effector family protein [Pseudonocardiaceae bacterium]